MVAKDNRKFRRYQRVCEIPITFRNRRLKARMLDYSFDGVGVLVEGSSVISKGDIIDIAISGEELSSGGEVVWSCIDSGGLRLGIRMPGAVKGLISDFGFSDTLIGLHRNRRTGILTIRHGQMIKKIYIRDGDLVFSASNQHEDRLGDLLLNEGRITQEQFDRTVEVMKTTGLKQGVVLVKLGYLKPQELVPVVKHQVEQIILSLFTLTDGEFTFDESALPPDGMITLKLSPAYLIYYGIRKMEETRQMREDFPSYDSILSLVSDPEDLFQEISLDSLGRKLVSLIDGNRTVQEIIAEARTVEGDAVRTLYALLSAGLARIKGLRAVSAPEAPADPSGISAAEAGNESSGNGADLPDFSEICKIHASYRQLGYYGILGLERSATASEIKKAYYRAAKKYHPDVHFCMLDASVRGKLSDIFSFVYEAYAALNNAARRAEYDEKQQAAPKKKTAEVDQARMKFEEGVVAFRSSNYHEAELLFGQAAYFSGKVPAYHFHYGLALARQNRVKPAIKAMERALSLEPQNADYNAELGFIFLGMNFHARAKSSFEKALKTNPGHVRANEGMSRLRSAVAG